MGTCSVRLSPQHFSHRGRFPSCLAWTPVSPAAPPQLGLQAACWKAATELLCGQCRRKAVLCWKAPQVAHAPFQAFSGPPACRCQLLPSTGEAAAGGNTQPQILLSSQCPPAPGEGKLSSRTAFTGGLILSAMEGSSTEAGPKGLPLPTSHCGGHHGQRTASACCNFIMGADCICSASQNTLPARVGREVLLSSWESPNTPRQLEHRPNMQDWPPQGHRHILSPG